MKSGLARPLEHYFCLGFNFQMTNGVPEAWKLAVLGRASSSDAMLGPNDFPYAFAGPVHPGFERKDPRAQRGTTPRANK